MTTTTTTQTILQTLLPPSQLKSPQPDPHLEKRVWPVRLEESRVSDLNSSGCQLCQTRRESSQPPKQQQQHILQVRLWSSTQGITPPGQRLLGLRTTAFCGLKGSSGLEVASSVACCSGVSIISPPYRSMQSQSTTASMSSYVRRLDIAIQFDTA